jgi:hypothetical protein
VHCHTINFTTNLYPTPYNEAQKYFEDFNSITTTHKNIRFAKEVLPSPTGT